MQDLEREESIYGFIVFGTLLLAVVVGVILVVIGFAA